MLFYPWGSKWPPIHEMGNITTFIYSYLPHSTMDLSSLYHSVRTVGNCAMSVGLAIPFCQTATQMLWERKRKKQPPLSSLPMVPAWAWQSSKTAANTQSKPSHVTNLGRQRPQHMTQTGTTACTCDPNQPAVNKCVGKSLKKPLQTGPGGLCPLCHVARLLWQGVRRLLSGIHPDSRILPEGLSELGIVHSTSSTGSTPWNFYAEGM